MKNYIEAKKRLKWLIYASRMRCFEVLAVCKTLAMMKLAIFKNDNAVKTDYRSQ